MLCIQAWQKITLWKEVNCKKEEKKASYTDCILIMYYKVMTYVLLLSSCVNIGAGSQFRMMFPIRGFLPMVAMNALVLSLRDAFCGACWLTDTGWRKPTPRGALTSQLPLSPFET